MSITKVVETIFAVLAGIIMMAYILDVRSRMRNWLDRHGNIQLISLIIMFIGSFCIAGILDGVSETGRAIKSLFVLFFLAAGIIAKLSGHEKSRKFFKRYPSLQGFFISAACIGFGGLMQIIITH